MIARNLADLDLDLIRERFSKYGTLVHLTKCHLDGSASIIFDDSESAFAAVKGEHDTELIEKMSSQKNQQSKGDYT